VDCSEALAGVAAVLLEVARHQRLDDGPVLRVEVAAGEEVLGQGPGTVAGPGLEGGDELALVDQAVLERQQAEEQVAVGVDGSHRAFLSVVRHQVQAPRPHGQGPPARPSP
jgi:hypothetical protein